MNVKVERCVEYRRTIVEEAIFSWEKTFSDIIKPGDIVVLKPNWIAESHRYKEGEWLQVVTHPTIIDTVLRLVLKKLRGKGKVTITDGPMTAASWEKLMKLMKPSRWVDMGKESNIDVKVLDLRDHEWSVKDDLIVERRKLLGDPLGSVVCDLGSHSEFVGKEPGKYGFFGSDYDNFETNDAHKNGKHFYKVSRTVLEADVFINLPKLKTHKKAGLTCSLKNLVGINTYKNWLPHHTGGTPSEGGDQFPEKNLRSITEGGLTRGLYSYLSKKPHLAKFFISLKRIGKVIFGDTRTTIRSGSWYGNDTLWRMVLDLNKILFYANTDGILARDAFESRKRYISLVDAVISGEGNGPDAPNRKDTGLIILGTDPVSVDCVCAKLMGFDWEKIPILRHAFVVKSYPFFKNKYDSIRVESSIEKYNKSLSEIRDQDTFFFQPSVGWIGNIESGISENDLLASR